MIRRFCDACNKEIHRSANRSRFKHQFLLVGDRSTDVIVDAMVTINGTTNSGDICAECIITTVSKGVFVGPGDDPFLRET